MGPLFWIPLVSEIGAFLAGILGVGFSLEARRHSRPGAPEHRNGSRGLALSVSRIVLVIVPNVLGVLLSRR